MQINTGSIALVLENTEGGTPRLLEDLDGEADRPFSPCVLTMLIGESEPTTLVALDLPTGLQLGDEDELPEEG